MAEPLVARRADASATCPNPYRGSAPGSSECVNGWRGLTPLALNPLFGTAGAGTEFYDPAVIAAVKWTHWDDLRNVYGVDADGYARVRVGQRRRPVRAPGAARREHHAGRVPEAERDRRAPGRRRRTWSRRAARSSPPSARTRPSFDPWSRRNMRLSPDGGVTPAPRRDGDIDGGERRLHVGHRLPRRDRHPDHRLAALPRAPARHAQRAPVVRLAQADAEPRRGRVQPGDLVHGRAARHAAVRPDARWRSRSSTSGWRTCAPSRSAAWCATSPRRRSTRASPPTARCSHAGANVVGRHPRRAARRGVHAGVPALLDLADRRGRADRGRRLQVRR